MVNWIIKIGLFLVIAGLNTVLLIIFMPLLIISIIFSLMGHCWHSTEGIGHDS